MEGWQVTAPILFEHFSFGWQALDVLNFQCRLDAHNLGPDIDAALMRGMPKPQDDRPCSDVHDAGPRAQVESVRALMREPLVPYVIVRDGWAMGEWYGGGGGESLYKWQHGRWFFIAGGGGAMGVEEMREYGVPQANWCTFGIYNAKCH